MQNLFLPNTKHLLKGFEGGSLAFFLQNTHKQTQKTQIVITDDHKSAQKLKDQILFFDSNLRVQCWQAFDTLPYRGMSPNAHIVHNQLKILSLALDQKVDILLISLQGILRRVLPVDFFQTHSVFIKQGDTLSLKDLTEKLVALGYERETLVEDKGHFAVRGDIVDIFSPQLPQPVRLSFFDTELESLKTFDPSTQRTQDAISHYNIIPAKQISLPSLLQDESASSLNEKWKSLLKQKTDAKNLPKPKRDEIEEYIKNEIYFQGIENFLPLFYNTLNTVFDYFPNDSLVTFATTQDWQQEIKEWHQKIFELFDDSEHIESIFSPKDLFLNSHEIFSHLKTRASLYLNWQLHAKEEAPQDHFGNFESNLKLKTQISTKISKIHNLAPFASEINQHRLQDWCCIIICQSLSQQKRFEDLLERFDLPLKTIANNEKNDFIQNVLNKKADPRLVYLMEGKLHEGFMDSQNQIWWICDEEIFGKKAKRSKTHLENTQVFSSFSELKEGDFLVHMDHGIGLFKGLVNLDFDVYKNDFLAIEYLGKDKLYVPVDNLNRVQRYVTEEGAIPNLDKLGSPSWKKVQAKAKKAARKLAGELLKIQALRDSQISYQFTANKIEMEEFETTFEFEETPDQMRAIDETLDDMMSTKPMDRLVCGDVGYGKTEVALRGAYLANLNNKQVAVLVPTTVLAFQHYTTFKERFKNYPVKVELMSRFRTAAEQKEVAQGLQIGSVDIVIGTHRLLSKDIKFRDLGLLIVDEEHRFGVIHKEKIKKFKSLVDVLTLTATPIPRTLNFALNGIRDLSIINTPPVDRLAIKTFTCQFDPDIMRDAIQKELRRGGQIYFLHNRVQSIERVTKKLKEIVPEARIRFGHGQMSENELEKLMIDFMNHKFDILVCTTIIESGIDIPNANTIIMDRADQLGLAQLYQLRGRVGRSHRQAYCYLITPSDDLITSKAKKRLATIQKFTELGSGFKVASHDLEIRGAGNILGDEQSGHIAAIGYDMYLQLLNEAIQELKNEERVLDFEPEIKLNITAKVPSSYIEDKHLRLILYKEISSANSQDDLTNIHDSWLDRFGTFPEEVKNLFAFMRIKAFAKKLLIQTVKENANGIILDFHEKHNLDPNLLIQRIQAQPHRYQFAGQNSFLVKNLLDKTIDKISNLQNFLNELYEENQKS